jgi:hypothetical protein
MSNQQTKLIPVYTSRGDVEAFLAYPYLYNRQGEWIGWVTRERDVYSVLGSYVGTFSSDPRILRKTSGDEKPHIAPPPPPSIRILPPPTVPLAPLMKELYHDTIDVLLDEPERLHTLDSGEFRLDMD